MGAKHFTGLLFCLSALLLVGAAIVPVKEPQDEDKQELPTTNSTLELVHVVNKCQVL